MICAKKLQSEKKKDYKHKALNNKLNEIWERNIVVNAGDDLGLLGM